MFYVYLQVWRALLKEMPLHSVLKILGKMTSNKILESGSSETQIICDRIQSESALKKVQHSAYSNSFTAGFAFSRVSIQTFKCIHQAKIHPFSILLASENYKRGQGYQGKTKWEPDSSIQKAMDAAFYRSFTVGAFYCPSFSQIIRKDADKHLG